MNYKNGEYTKEEFNQGETLGIGVFETILVADKTANHLFEHYERLICGCKVLKIDFVMDYEVFKEKVYNYLEKVLEKNEKEKLALKVLIRKNKTSYDFIMTTREILYSEKDYEKGIKVGISKVLKNPTSPLTYIKSINYGENLLELNKGKEDGFDEMIFFNYKGYLTEGTKSNLFWIKDGIVKTPKLECGLLNGIMRAKVIKRLLECEMKVIEGKYTLIDLLEADGVFMTNSLMEIMPVREIKDNRMK